MNVEFDINNVSVVTFGVGQDNDNGQSFVALPTDGHVQDALVEMVSATLQAMYKDTGDPPLYEPSEKHGATEYLYLPLTHDLAGLFRQLHEAANLPLDPRALENPEAVFCYFARMKDKKGHRITAIRKASQFKGVLKKRLLRFGTDALELIDDRVFKLDSDFDMLVDADNIHVLRPSAFEFTGKLQDAILDTVPLNIAAIQKDLLFVDFTGVQVYAATHPRAARYLASIRAQKEMKNIDKSALRRLCKDTGVEVKESKGRVFVDTANIMGLLEVLDRRRYEVELVKGSPERFRAASRRKIGVDGS